MHDTAQERDEQKRIWILVPSGCVKSKVSMKAGLRTRASLELKKEQVKAPKLEAKT